jgi:hypothetical protein
MCRGFECGDGWFHLIDAFCARIEWMTNKNDMPPLVFTQIKEKFGSLRLRFKGGDERARQMAEVLLELSFRIDEVTGYPKPWPMETHQIGATP